MSCEEDDARLSHGAPPKSGWRRFVDIVVDFLDGLEFLVWAARLVWSPIRWLFGLLRHVID
ncbi:hypothetical protein [Methylocystis parvus]|uniref:Uncharacterized protein n=1 Tax=Methylocystis parvus TaxID=134 RepID=A0A6B8M3Z4_9HYPH|nr:hypothetical protein [Methylocystis parvus]QGM97075.1 hypothetical protein F7D14_06040 [Methylocystis parvus]WBJ99023.1 hypothetical protein MMG94_13570 [Methylocystis parvus OBBP]